MMPQVNQLPAFQNFCEPGHMDACEDRGAYFYVVAFSNLLMDDLIVAEFPYDSTSPDAVHYKAAAHAMAIHFQKASNVKVRAQENESQ
jgi:hypothetical protein